MIRASVLALFATLMICGFCGKEFESLGRHSWRCKSKVEYDMGVRAGGGGGGHGGAQAPPKVFTVGQLYHSGKTSHHKKMLKNLEKPRTPDYNE